MAASDAPATFLELRTHFLEALKEVTGVSAVNTIVNRYINLGLQTMHQEDWPWAERQAVILTHDNYTTGTADIALATRTTVTGTGTLWNTAVTGMGFNNTRAGGKLTFAGASDVYEVTSVASDTSLTLVDRFIGAAALVGAAYEYFEDEYALASDYWRPIGEVALRYFDKDNTIEVLEPQDFYQRFGKNSAVGTPTHAAIVERGPSGSVALRPRVVLAPPPSALRIIPYRYYTTNLAVSAAGVGAANLSADTDEPIVPLRWRMSVIYKGLELWSRDRKDDARAELYKRSYEDLRVAALHLIPGGDTRLRRYYEEKAAATGPVTAGR